MNTLSSEKKYYAIEKFSAVALSSLFLVQIYSSRLKQGGLQIFAFGQVF